MTGDIADLRQHIGDGSAVGWLLLPQEAVPPTWARRAIPLALVPLLPTEAGSILAGETAEPDLLGDEDLLRLVAQGLTREVVARRLGVSVRTVQRRLAHAQSRVGVGSFPELMVELARRGFR